MDFSESRMSIRANTASTLVGYLRIPLFNQSALAKRTYHLGRQFWDPLLNRLKLCSAPKAVGSTDQSSTRIKSRCRAFKPFSYRIGSARGATFSSSQPAIKRDTSQ